MDEKLQYAVAQLRRRLIDIMTFGQVRQVSEIGDKVKVYVEDNYGEILTDFLPVIGDSRKGYRLSQPFKKGEMVAILNPNGDFSGAVVLGTIRVQDSVAKNPELDFEDGSKVSYEPDKKELSVITPESGKVSISTGKADLKAKEVSIEAKGALRISHPEGELLTLLGELLDKLSSAAPAFVKPDTGSLNPAAAEAISSVSLKLKAMSGGGA